MNNIWLCHSCGEKNTQGFFCMSCECPSFASSNEVDEWINGRALNPVKPDTDSDFYIWGDSWTLTQKVGVCPYCSSSMYCIDCICPSCKEKLTLNERKGLYMQYLEERKKNMYMVLYFLIFIVFISIIIEVLL